MAGNRADRAKGIDSIVPEYQFREIEPDSNIGLALLANHVYNIDHFVDFDSIPGFELLSGTETADLLDIEKTVMNGKDIVFDFINYEYTACDEYKCKNIDNITMSIKENGCISSGPVNPKEISDTIFKSSVKYITSKIGNSNIFRMDVDTIISILKERINSIGTGFKAGIYKKKTDNYSKKEDIDIPEYLLVFAGSDNILQIENLLSDWINTNAMQGLGFFPTQYKLAIFIATKLKKKKLKFIIVGHSLGGGLASCAAVVSGTQSIVFNPSGLNTLGLAIYLNFENWKGLQNEIIKSYNDMFSFKNQLLAKDLNHFKKLLSGDLLSLKNCILDDVLLKDFNAFKGVLTNDLELFKGVLSNEVGMIKDLSEVNALYQDLNTLKNIFNGNILTNDIKTLKGLLFDGLLTNDLAQIKNTLSKDLDTLKELCSKNYLSSEYDNYKSSISNDIETLKSLRSKYDLYTNFPKLRDSLFSEQESVLNILNNDVKRIKEVLSTELLSNQITPLKNAISDNLKSLDALSSNNIESLDQMLLNDRKTLDELLLQDPNSFDLNSIQTMFFENISGINQSLSQDIIEIKTLAAKDYTQLDDLLLHNPIEGQLDEIKNIVSNDYSLIENTLSNSNQSLKKLFSEDTYIQYFNLLKENIGKDLGTVKEIISRNVEGLINKLNDTISQKEEVFTHDSELILGITKKYPELLGRIISGDFFTENISALKNTFNEVVNIIKEVPSELQKIKDMVLDPNKVETLFDDAKSILNKDVSKLEDILSPDNLYAKLKSVKNIVTSDDFLEKTSIYKEYESLKSQIENLISNNPISIVNKVLQTQASIKAGASLVTPYCSKTDMLTNTQNNLAGYPNNKFEEIAGNMGDVGAFIGKTLTGFASPVSKTVSEALQATGKGVGLFTASILTKTVIPPTFGTRIEINTDELNLTTKENAYGHCMKLLLDGFFLYFHTINNNEDISYQKNEIEIIIHNQWNSEKNTLKVLYQILNNIYLMPDVEKIKKIFDSNNILGSGWEKPAKRSKWNVMIESDDGKKFLADEIKADKDTSHGQAQSNSAATGTKRAMAT